MKMILMDHLFVNAVGLRHDQVLQSYLMNQASFCFVFWSAFDARFVSAYHDFPPPVNIASDIKRRLHPTLLASFVYAPLGQRATCEMLRSAIFPGDANLFVRDLVQLAAESDHDVA